MAESSSVFLVLFSVLLVGVDLGSAKGFATLDHLVSSTPAAAQAATVQGLITRLIPQRAGEFQVVVNSSIGPAQKDTFILETVGDKLRISGSSGVAAAWGFQYYLKRYCGCQFTWAGSQLSLPSTLPTIATPGLKVTSNDRFRYYQNVCTVSYSFVWWNWTRWEREIDWMALNGINLPLAFNGQEAIWQTVYLKLGLSQQELDNHFGGPAFLAWARMGNIRGWGGPLPQSWHVQQVALQKQILQRMRGFGMIPVLPGFAGHVPKGLQRVYPQAQISRLSDWCGFNDTYCCSYLLEPTDPLFTRIGQAFVQELTKEFGTDHVYNADTFNEMTPRSSDPSYVAAAGRAVYEGLVAGDPQAIWVMQGWIFENDAGFWKVPQVKSLLTSVPQGKMIVLDLMADLEPQYTRFSSFYGQPFIWCLVGDFGGTLGMYAALENINKGPIVGRAYANSTMIGTGLTMEGINNNEVMFEFMLENSWRKEARNITEWISDFAKRRYGKTNRQIDFAWQLLKRSVFNSTTGYKQHGKYVILRRPSKNLRPNQGILNCSTGQTNGNVDDIVTHFPQLSPVLTGNIWYKPEDVFRAWDNFIKVADTLSHSELFRYDLVDLTRQSLQVIAIQKYTEVISAFKTKNMPSLVKASMAFLDLLLDLDTVLVTDRHFLLGAWLEDAKALGTNEQEKKLYEYNARNQVTLWGPRGEIRDYANKQWAGLVHGYYMPRWMLFTSQLRDALTKGVPFDQAKFNQDVFTTVEQVFTFDRSIYPSKPIGDSIEQCKRIHTLYRPQTKIRFYKKLQEFSKRGKKFVKYASRWMKKSWRKDSMKQSVFGEYWKQALYGSEQLAAMHKL